MACQKTSEFSKKRDESRPILAKMAATRLLTVVTDYSPSPEAPVIYRAPQFQRTSLASFLGQVVPLLDVCFFSPFVVMHGGLPT